MRKPVTNQELIEAFRKFDAELDLDEEKIAGMPARQKAEIFISIQKVLEYRESFPPDLADAVQQLAKQSVEKNPDQEGIISLDPDSDGIVLETGEIITPDDELFPFAKQLSAMGSKDFEKFVDDLGVIVAGLGNAVLVKLMKKQVTLLDKKLQQLETERGINNDKQNDKDKGKWKTFTNQM